MLITELTLGETYTFIGFKRDINHTDLVEDNKHVDAHSNYFIKYYYGKSFKYDEDLNENNIDKYYYFKTNLVKTDGTDELDDSGQIQIITISLANPEHSYNGFFYKLTPIFEVLPESEPELETEPNAVTEQEPAPESELETEPEPNAVPEPEPESELETEPEYGFEIKTPLHKFLLDVPVEQLVRNSDK